MYTKARGLETPLRSSSTERHSGPGNYCGSGPVQPCPSLNLSDQLTTDKKTMGLDKPVPQKSSRIRGILYKWKGKKAKSIVDASTPNTLKETLGCDRIILAKCDPRHINYRCYASAGCMLTQEVDDDGEVSVTTNGKNRPLLEELGANVLGDAVVVRVDGDGEQVDLTDSDAEMEELERNPARGVLVPWRKEEPKRIVTFDGHRSIQRLIGGMFRVGRDQFCGGGGMPPRFKKMGIEVLVDGEGMMKPGGKCGPNKCLMDYGYFGLVGNAIIVKRVWNGDELHFAWMTDAECKEVLEYDLDADPEMNGDEEEEEDGCIIV